MCALEIEQLVSNNHNAIDILTVQELFVVGNIQAAAAEIETESREGNAQSASYDCLLNETT